MNIKKKSFSGEVKDSVIFPFYFLLNKLHKPTPPPLPPRLCDAVGGAFYYLGMAPTLDLIFVSARTNNK
jgi:hypothetical protein